MGLSIQTFNFGDVRVTSMYEGDFGLPAKAFTGADAGAINELLPSGSTPCPIISYLVKAEGRLMLVDAGNGALPELLELCGTAPDAIDAVMLTHMHPDHIAGLLADDRAFLPRATFFAAAAETAYWLGKPPRDSAMQRAVLKKYAGRVRTFEPDMPLETGFIPREASGHTPGHTVFEYGSLLFTGDLVHAAELQLVRPEVSSVIETDMTASEANRRKYYTLAAKRGMTVFGAHLPRPGAARVRISEDAFILTP
ncbi:MAG: MBL fold metallo-hydrolase [Victivallaceae bacterium]|nr:MBL fold metallo-hydrolase [Victivallaceae bacterium]